MAFASIYVPGFIVQAALRAEPALRGARSPFPMASSSRNDCSREQRALRSGCTAEHDQGASRTVSRRRNSPPPSEAHEESAHAALLDLGWSVSPRVEDTAPDTIVLDLDGLSSLFGSEAEIAATLTRRASSLGLTVHVAVAANLESAIHAARGFPGITVIAPGEEAQRLGPLPVSVLSPPMEILETLDRWGVRTCAALAALPLLDLSERLGKWESACTSKRVVQACVRCCLPNPRSVSRKS